MFSVEGQRQIPVKAPQIPLTQDSLVDFVSDVEALGICKVLQQKAIDPKTLVMMLRSLQ